MAAVETGTFTDTFEASDSRWNANYGGAATSGGLGRVPCAHLGGVPQYAGLESTSPGGSDTWTIALSQISAKLVTVPAGDGATTAYCEMAILSGTSGTYLSILYDAVSGYMSFTSRTGWSDPSGVYLAYNPTNHRWLRIRDSSGTILWETSPDGNTWTTQRTLNPAPAWTGTDAVTILLDCARDGGTNDYAEWDYLNTTPTQPASVSAVAAVGAPTVSASSTVAPGTVAATAAIGAPGLSTSSTVAPGTVTATAAIDVPGLSVSSTVSPGTVAATAAVGTPTLSTSTKVTPGPVVAIATIGVPKLLQASLHPLCAQATVRGLAGSATIRVLGGTGTARGLTGSATVQGDTACLP